MAKSARFNMADPAESIAGMARVGAPRVPVGNSAVQSARNASRDAAGRFLEGRKDTQGADPTAPGTKQNRKQTMTTGASFGIRAEYISSQSPEAGRTQDNVRTVGSAINRTRPNFNAGARY